jgi:hypothetical protein
MLFLTNAPSIRDIILFPARRAKAPTEHGAVGIRVAGNEWRAHSRQLGGIGRKQNLGTDGSAATIGTIRRPSGIKHDDLIEISLFFLGKQAGNAQRSSNTIDTSGRFRAHIFADPALAIAAHFQRLERGTGEPRKRGLFRPGHAEKGFLAGIDGIGAGRAGQHKNTGNEEHHLAGETYLLEYRLHVCCSVISVNSLACRRASARMQEGPRL